MNFFLSKLKSEVTGPSLGRCLSENFDFLIVNTIMAAFSLVGVIIYSSLTNYLKVVIKYKF
jgi:hypothetical protein